MVLGSTVGKGVGTLERRHTRDPGGDFMAGPSFWRRGFMQRLEILSMWLDRYAVPRGPRAEEREGLV